MSIQFKPTAIKNSLSPEKNIKYYAKAVNTGETDFNALLAKTAKATKLNIVDAVRFYHNLEAIIQKELADGKIVRLGGIGSFQVGISSEGADTPKEVTAQKITKAKVNYRPGVAFKEMLVDLKFKKV